MGIHYQNVVEITEVKGVAREEIVKTRIEIMEAMDEKYVSKEYLKFIVDDIKEIKFMLKEREK